MPTPLRTTPARPTKRYRTVYVDPDALGRVPQQPTDRGPARETGLRLISVEDRVAGCRRNVRDAARAVLAWAADVMQGDRAELAAVLDDCLRPGPDAQHVNFAALAARINAARGTALTAKRVRTAIENLRHAAAAEARPRDDAGTDRLAALQRRLEANFDQLVVAAPRRDQVRRALATELLAAVRCAAGRLIVKPYGEGIPVAYRADRLEGRLLALVRDLIHDAPPRVEADLRTLLRVLGRADDSTESHMRLVVAGARVVCDLLGADSLAGLLAQLNVQVVGRDLLGSELYLAELHRIAEAAAALHADRATLRYQNWARRLDPAARVPAPLRVASFARNNFATHILERLITGEMADADALLPHAEAAIEAMRRTDASFFLLPLTEAIHLTALAEIGRDRTRVLDHFRAMGDDAATRLLCDLAKFDSSRPVVEAVRRHAVAALPDLRHRVIAA